MSPLPESKKAKHPMQPVIVDRHGTHRFKGNVIVQFLLDNGGFDMNKLAAMHFEPEEREQFAQLIGYSVCGFGELGYVSDATYRKAARQSGELLKAGPQ